MIHARLNARGLTWTLIAAGIAICLLTLNERSAGSLACPTSGCKIVQSSAYAHIFGLPLAVAGLVGLLALGGLLGIKGYLGRVLAAGLAAGSALFALYLIGLQLFVIGAVCAWCIANDTIAVALALLICYRLVAARDDA
jgi:uncharacterized membrane protein